LSVASDVNAQMSGESQGGDSNLEDDEHRIKRRNVNVYDAVAGRVGWNGLLTAQQRDSPSTRPLAPEEILLRSIGDAAIDQDRRNQNGNHPRDDDLNLPKPELLMAAHAYASDYYSSATTNRGQIDFRSLDGSALVAVGILLEEAARASLGQNGDMALVEPRQRDNSRWLPFPKLSTQHVKGKVRSRIKSTHATNVNGNDSGSEALPTKKRRT
jgi:hypothetical protein